MHHYRDPLARRSHIQPFGFNGRLAAANCATTASADAASRCLPATQVLACNNQRAINGNVSKAQSFLSVDGSSISRGAPVSSLKNNCSMRPFRCESAPGVHREGACTAGPGRNLQSATTAHQGGERFHDRLNPFRFEEEHSSRTRAVQRSCSHIVPISPFFRRQKPQTPDFL